MIIYGAELERGRKERERKRVGYSKGLRGLHVNVERGGESLAKTMTQAQR